MSTLVAGVGYPYLRDMSLGCVLAAELQEETWPAHVLVDDYSFGPIAVVHRWQEMSEPFKKVIFFGAMERGKKPGEITQYQWDQPALSNAQVQDRVAEAVTGVISMDNLLIITSALGVLPRNTIVMEVEPGDVGWGAGFSEPVQRAIPTLRAMLKSEAEDVAKSA
ncbi:MAG: hydrogenase maturation protease [Candidatus Eremiobacteraeota bacterium]|nr:hydrogenase maturation protease [Candidatus Eremiobacteraeota bacterium]